MSQLVDYHNHDLDAADSFASKALARLKKEEIPATPQNFEVFYAFYANINPNLKEELKALHEKEGEITARDCQDLYEKYINSGMDRERVQRAGDQIQATLQDVSGVVQNVKEITGDYNGSLKGIRGKIVERATPEELRDIVDALTKDTERMMQYNDELEKRLDHSSIVMKDLKKDLERIRREAVTDGLTGLANRKSFDDQIGRLWRDCSKNGGTFSLLMVDIDHFKPFNDNYGHQVGDQVLRLVAMTMINEVKGQDMAARYGGEEFAILLPDTNINAAQSVGENLRQAIEQKEIINRATGKPLGRITVSIGAAQYYSLEDVDGLIDRADKALYASKNKGRNQVTLADTPHDIN
ncbi:MAG: diguanylate cyclase [Pseudomonadota bacterium]